LDYLEKGLKQTQEKYGDNSLETTKVCKEICVLTNILATEYLKNEAYDLSLQILQRAQLLCGVNNEGKAIAYNNTAHYYKKIGKPKVALSFFQSALHIEKELANSKNIGDAHLNICAVLSQLNKHDIALLHGISAVSILQEILLEEGSLSKERASVLAVAYHNIGVEQEFMKRVIYLI